MARVPNSPAHLLSEPWCLPSPCHGPYLLQLGAQGEEALQRLRLVEEAVLALTTAAATGNQVGPEGAHDSKRGLTGIVPGPGLVEAAVPRPTLAALDDELLAALRSRTAIFSKRGKHLEATPWNTVHTHHRDVHKEVVL